MKEAETNNAASPGAFYILLAYLGEMGPESF